MFALLRSHLRLSLLAVALAVGAVLWLVNGWLVHRVLPPFLHKQLTAVLQREVEFADVNTNWLWYFEVKGLSVAASADPKAGKLFRAGKLVFRYHIVRLLRYLPTSNPLGGIRRVEIIEPSVEVPLEQLQEALAPSPRSGAKKPKEASMTLPPLPKTYVGIKSGTFVVTRRGVPVLEIRRIKAELDLRDLPQINGSVNFTIAPESSVSVDGGCHLSLKKFKGELALDRLDLGQLSDLARMLDPELAVRVGGLLDAKLEIEGGFIDGLFGSEMRDQSFGRGSLRLAQGSLALRGNPLITDAETSGYLDERQVVLEGLTARVFSGALSAAGSLGNLGQGRLRLRGKLEQVPIRALRALSPGLPSTLDGAFTFEFSASGTGRSPVFAGRIASPALWIPGFRVENLFAEMVYTIKELELTNLKANLWEGGIHGAGALRGLDGPDPTIKFDLQGIQFNVARTPLGDGYAGTADLTAKLEGPLDRLVGTLAARVNQVRARGLAVGDLAADAKFEGGKVRIEAKTDKGTVSAAGTLVLSPVLALEDCRAEVHERIPVLIALVGVEPPPGFDGRVSGSVRAEGPVSDPVVTAEAVGSAVRYGKMVIGDVIRVPKFTFRKNTLEVPSDAPAELEWSAERTTIAMSGSVPVGALSGRGKEELRFHLECAQGRMELLRRLDLVKDANGVFDLYVDLAGTASQPAWKLLRFSSAGKRLVLKEPAFDRDFSGWSANVVIENDEGAVKDTWLGLDRQQQTFSGRFGMRGWLPEDMDVQTATVAAKPKYLRGLPLSLEDFAEIRVRLDAHLIKQPGESQIMLSGSDPEKGAELTLASGVIRYAGPKMGEVPGGGATASSAAVAATRTAEGRPAGRPPEPSIFEKLYANLNFIGTVTIGQNVEFAPRTMVGKASQSFFKLLTGDRAALKKLFNQYATRAGWMEFSRDALLTFDLKIKDGSHLKVSKMGEALRAEGELALEPGGRVTLGPPGLSVDFTIVGDPGLRQRIEFPVGETMMANLDLVAETVLYDKYLPTDVGGEPALVDELKVRLYVTPPRPDEPRKDSFLQFNFDLKSEPETVVGEVGGGGIGAAAAAPGADSASQARMVTVKPDKGALMMALFGLDALNMAGSSSPAGGGPGAGETIKQTGAMAIFNAILNPIRRLLGLDVLSVRKSDLAARRQRQSSAGSSVQSTSASVLDNTELTAGVALTRNLFLNQRVVLLDSTQSAVQSSSMAPTRSNTTGFITEIEFRRSSYKLTTRGRWFGLPDDPRLDQPFELYGGVEVSQGFSGISRREPFIW